MDRKARISPSQLSFLLMGFLFGSVNISHPARAAAQNSWLAHMIGWGLGFIFVTIYIWISVLNPRLTLIEILRKHFGRVLGTIVGILYIWYFLHLSSLIVRTLSEFMITVHYEEASVTLLVIALLIPTTYAIKKGVEVFARATEISIPVLLATIILVIILSVSSFDLDNFKPFLEDGWAPVLNAGFLLSAFPFGEVVVFLMFFPFLNKKEKIFKATYTGLFFGGIFLLLVLLRDLLVIGPDMLVRHLFPPHTTVTIIPASLIAPVVSVNLTIGAGIQMGLCIYAATLGITQLVNLIDYKPLVLPVSTIAAALAIWIHPNYPHMFTWSAANFAYYSLPFHLFIPLLLLIISLVKNRKINKSKVES